MSKVWSFRINNKILCNNSKIDRIWFALETKELGPRAFNKNIYWKIN